MQKQGHIKYLKRFESRSGPCQVSIVNFGSDIERKLAPRVCKSTEKAEIWEYSMLVLIDFRRRRLRPHERVDAMF
jgi:hypothetical protein